MEKLEMASSEKGFLSDELEKGEYALVGTGRRHVRWLAWREEGWAVYFKIMISIALLLFLGHNACRAHPKAVALRVDGVPQFVLDYAPITYLDIAEAYFPSDIAAQITNTHPSINNTAIPSPPPLNITNLSLLNTYGHHGWNVYLTSDLDVTTSPSWLTGVVPDSSTGKTHTAISAAIITNTKTSSPSLVDAFYMYFYAYNQGNTVLGRELGDHIGDWEHNMIRFRDGVPETIWFSQHGNGEAFTYDAVEKDKHTGGKRPVNYSARGSHANYATVGKHDHTIPDLNLPNGFILDHTSKGTRWDPTLNAYFYDYCGNSSMFESVNGSPVAAMEFRGRWGDEQYPAGDPRQPEPFFGFVKYVSGPSGPITKQLEREKVCPDNGILCIIRDRLGP